MEIEDEDQGPTYAATLKRRLGERIKELRTNQKLTQEKVADDADLTQHYLSQIEQGERNVSIVSLYAIARALGLSLSELLQGIE